MVEICTEYAQKGMFNIFLTVFFATLAFAFVEPYFFIGYLISIALFGLYQAIFMANAGGAWDNAKKIVEVELKQKGTPLHDATVVGDTVGDPFKDTSSVALNPIIKFTTLFGLLAVELAVAHRRARAGSQPRAGRRLPGRSSLLLRLPVVLRDADRSAVTTRFALCGPSGPHHGGWPSDRSPPVDDSASIALSCPHGTPLLPGPMHSATWRCVNVFGLEPTAVLLRTMLEFLPSPLRWRL